MLTAKIYGAVKGAEWKKILLVDVNELIRVGDWRQAASALESGLQTSGDQALRYTQLSVCYLRLNDLDRAERCAHRAIELNPSFAHAYSNLGSIYKARCQFEEAKNSFLKALELNPNLHGVSFNLGNLFRQMEQIDDAVRFYEKARDPEDTRIAVLECLGECYAKLGKVNQATFFFRRLTVIQPQNAEYFYQLGLLSITRNNADDAISHLRDALKRTSKQASIYEALGRAFELQKDTRMALASFAKSLTIDPKNDLVRKKLARIVSGKWFSSRSELSISALQLLIENLPEHFRIQSFVKPSISLLKFEPTIRDQLSWTTNQDGDFEILINTLSSYPLLLNLMGLTEITDLDFEDLFTNVRRHLLFREVFENMPTQVGSFVIALCLQCFINEYIFDVTSEELDALSSLENHVQNLINDGQQPSDSKIVTLASYRSLSDYSWSQNVSRSQRLEAVYQMQIDEPRMEQRIRSTIANVGRISDSISLTVKDQYEENPYPRWIHSSAIRAMSLEDILEFESGWSCAKSNITRGTLKILVAGCGTGQHAIEAAKRFRDCSVTAIDLSLTSLSYARRKADELSIDNLQFAQCDILDVEELHQTFDVIECAGVLHHMDQPQEGWRALTRILNEGGFMRIGLYSELARSSIINARQDIRSLGYTNTLSDMRKFRKLLRESSEAHHRELISFWDFYSTSNFRDLLFNVQEHRFTIPLLAECLSELDLQFCGFIKTSAMRNAFEKSGQSSHRTNDLLAWQPVEEANPGLFAGMYQFWCRKK